MSLVSCPECNKEISEEAEKCPNCGFILQKKHSIIGIIGFAMSIISYFCGIYFSFFISTIALILCIIGCMQKNKKHLFAIIGNVLSIILIIVYLIFIIQIYQMG